VADALTPLRTCLSDPRRYAAQIDRLHRRYLFTRHLYELQQDDVSLAAVVQRRSKIARVLARTVARGTYEFEPGRMRKIRVHGKERIVFAYRLTDLIVHGVVADIVQEAMTPHLSPQLYSYRKGVSWWTGIADFASYARDHRRSRSDPRSRGLYVLRRDVDSYTDTIPVEPASALWTMLRDILGEASEQDWSVVAHVVRPVARRLGGGALACPVRGVPTGQPIASAMFNLYLSGLDHELAAVPGGFYARYSDDILFAHPDADVARRADEVIDETLLGLRLGVSEHKGRTIYLTGAGRGCEAWPEAAGATTVPFLGTSISAGGTVALHPVKLRRLLRDIEARARRTVATLGSSDLERAGRVVCGAVNRALAPRPSPYQSPSALLLRRAVTDRPQLREVDYLLARIVLRAVDGDGNVRAFRRVPYRKIREDWGLVSLLHARNGHAA
jgi:hypothetical protein